MLLQWKKREPKTSSLKDMWLESVLSTWKLMRGKATRRGVLVPLVLYAGHLILISTRTLQALNGLARLLCQCQLTVSLSKTKMVVLEA